MMVYKLLLIANCSRCLEQAAESPATNLTCFCLFVCLRALIFVLLDGLFNPTISSFVNYAAMENSHQLINVSVMPACHPWKLVAKRGE